MSAERLIGPLRCLECGEVLDLARDPTAPPEERPEAGDVSLCTYCGAVAIFDRFPAGGLMLRRTTDEEKLDLAATPQLQAMIRELKERK
jgi:hypothetical protein